MKKELFEQLLSKHEEYLDCVAHVHLRGIRDVKEETIEILDELIFIHISGRQLKTYLKTSGIEIDDFFKSCIKYLKKGQ